MANKKHNTKKFHRTATTTTAYKAEPENAASFLVLYGDEKGETRRSAKFRLAVPEDVETYRKTVVKTAMRGFDDAKRHDKSVTQFSAYLVYDEKPTSIKGNIFYDPQSDIKSDEKTAFNAIKEDFEEMRAKRHEEAAAKAAEKGEAKKPEVSVAASKTSPKAEPKATISAAKKTLIGEIVNILATKSEEQLKAIKTMLG